MKPGEVMDLGQRLTDAIKAEDEDTAALTAIELLLGVAFNIAVIANQCPETNP
jgi:hypothetical protein